MQYPLSLLIIALAFTLVSCSGSGKATTTSEVVAPGMLLAGTDIGALYINAVNDAKNPEPTEISHTLTHIKGNPRLVDTIINGEWYLLVASWKSNSSYYPDRGAYNTGKYDIWVTVAPQIQERCQLYQPLFPTSENLALRLQQLLGLPPNGPERFFLELWVHPDDLFRPCPDNETDDTRCDLVLRPDTDSAYRAWFNNLRAVQYVDCSNTEYEMAGYPWTQLGYTYDWNPTNSSHIGLSEFVIRQNADVWVRRKVSTEDYCNEKNK